jgi:hypothetical protein
LKNPNLNNRLRDTTYVVMQRVDGVIYVDDPKGAARKVQECQDFKHPLVIGGAPTTFDKVHEFLGHPPYKMVSDLPKPAPRNNVKSQVAQFKRYAGWHWSHGRGRFGAEKSVFDWYDANVNLSDGGYYVPIYGNNPCIDKHEEGAKTIGAGQFSDFINSLKEYGLIPKDTTVYGLPASHKKLVDKPEFQGWTNIFRLAEKRFETLSGSAARKRQSKQKANLKAQRLVLDNQWVRMAVVVNMVRNRLKDAAPLIKLADHYKNMEKNDDYALHQEWVDLGKFLEQPTHMPKGGDDGLESLITDIDKRYPLLQYALDADQNRLVDYINLVDQS